MGLYIIAYDLTREGDYKSIEKELENFNAVKILETTWCFKRQETDAASLRDHFMKFISDKDRLMVVRVADYDGICNWATIRQLGSPNDLK